MARLTIGDKAERLLRLLMGMRHPRVAAALVAHGFTDADLDEGWALLRGLAGNRLDTAPTPVVNVDDLTRLDQLENRWFPIANATLARHYPKVLGRVFLNLTQTEGPAVILSMGTFVTRVEALEAATASAEDQAARALLSKRGLTADVLTEAKKLIASLGKIQPAPAVDEAALLAARTESAEAMWRYYLEWSEIVRSAVSNRQLLRQLGFLHTTHGDDDSEDPK